MLVDGERINSCLGLAVQFDGCDVTTIEGLAVGDALHPMQAAFIDFDGFQCGYCTSGQICSAIAMLREHAAGRASAVTEHMTVPADLSDDEIRERMSGNVCRCAAYNGIVDAIRLVADGEHAAGAGGATR